MTLAMRHLLSLTSLLRKIVPRFSQKKEMRIFESVFICGFILFLLIEGAFYAGRSLWTDDWEFSVKSGLYHGSPFEYLVDQG